MKQTSIHLEAPIILPHATNAYDELKQLLTEKYETNKTVPKQIEAIQAKDTDYSILELKCGLKIPPPLSEIEKTNTVAAKIIKNIDTYNNRLFNIYHNIIEKILKFVQDNDILYVTTTDDKYSKEERKAYDIQKFAQEASALDKLITEVFPDLETPISKILNEMKLDNSLNQATKYLNNFKTRLLKIYRDGLSDIFKLITIADGD